MAHTSIQAAAAKTPRHTALPWLAGILGMAIAASVNLWAGAQQDAQQMHSSATTAHATQSPVATR